MPDKWLFVRVKTDTLGDLVLLPFRLVVTLAVWLIRALLAFFPWLIRKVKDEDAAHSTDQREMIALCDRVKLTYLSSPWSDVEHGENFAAEIVWDATKRAGREPISPLGEALYQTACSFIEFDGSLFGFPEPDPTKRLSLEEGVELRKHLTRKERFLDNQERYADIFREKLIRIFEAIMGYLPPIVFQRSEHGGASGDNSDCPALPLSVSCIDLCRAPAELVERLIVTMFDDDITDAELYHATRVTLDRNLLRASNIPPEEANTSKKDVVIPTKAKNRTPTELVDTYLIGTPFHTLFFTPLPFTVPESARFEHTHILGGTGHGKTQLLKLLIHNDLERLRNTRGSVVVIESQGDLVDTISHLKAFAPGAEDSLAERLVIVDPNDVEYPLSLNLFDVQRDRLASYAPREREVILNGTVELFEYLFGALLGAELTQKQGLLFRYLARLLLVIPEATIYTLVSLMENPKPYREYIALLDRSSRSFFETQFFDPSFGPTRKQILRRLWGVLSNPTFERIFSHPRNSLDLFTELNQGKVILINTAKDLLKKEGAEIFGRFFIAMIAQATLERSVLRDSERVPTFVYVDEAHEYIDERIEELLNQARKYKVGLVLAHQHLDQLTTVERSTFMANASIRFVGGVSAKDARVLREEMRTTDDFILSARKREAEQTTEFVCFVKNVTPQAVKVSVPLGTVDALPRMQEAEHAALIDRNRDRYCAPLTELPPFPEALPRAEEPLSEAPHEEMPASVPDAAPEPKTEPVEAVRPTPLSKPKRAATKTPEAAPIALGRGGPQHKYLQELIKQAAEARGFRATIEEQIEGGSVDVSLGRDGIRVACEISVTSSKEQELGNIGKCLAAGYEHVLMIATNSRRLASLRKAAMAALEAPAAERVRFLSPEELVVFLDTLVAERTTTEETVRGWRVKVRQQTTTDADALARKQAIASVIAKSLGSLGERA